jgi:hypothetical protein
VIVSRRELPRIEHSRAQSIMWLILVIIAGLSICGGIAKLFLTSNAVNYWC